jgi:hypothetical protein
MFRIFKITTSLISVSLASDLIEIDVERVPKTMHDINGVYTKNIKYYTNDCLAGKAFIGSDKQPFMFLLDTGSLYTWV